MRRPRLALGRALALGLLLGAVGLLPAGAQPAEAGPDAGGGPVARFPLIDSSHDGRINRLVYNEAQNLLFSIGEDGTVRVWDPQEGRIQRLLRVSRLPLKMLAVRPDHGQFAVAESDSLKSFRLSVWDTRRETKVFDLDLRDPPLFLAWSPLGRYLVYGRPEYDSLVILDTRTWSRLPLLEQGFGIVSFAQVSRNERNIMTYQPSGWITYLEIETGRTLRRVKCPPELSAIALSPDNLFLAGAQGDDLVIVDLLSGQLVTRARLPAIQSIAFSPQGNEITCLTADRPSRWYFNRKELLELFLPELDLTAQPPAMQASSAGAGRRLSALTYAGNRIYLGDEAGAILYLLPGMRTGVMARNQLLEISDLDLAAGVLAAVGPRQVVCLFSDYLSPQAAEPRGEVRLKTWPNPFPGGSRLKFAEDGSLFVWSRGDQPGAFAVLDPQTGALRRTYSDFASPLVQLDVGPQGIITIEKSGQCRILDRATFNTVFQYWAPGMNRLAAAGRDLLIGGKSAISEFGSALLRINRWTGETVSIPDPSSIIYDLLYDTGQGWLFSLGVERSGQEVQTVLKMHYGLGYTQDREIYRYEGEDLNASMAVEQDAWTTLYFSVGDGVVTSWNGYRFNPLESSTQAPRRLYVLGRMLFALNRDSSITVWDTRSRRLLLQFYLFKDLEWAALFADGTQAVSPGGGRYLVQRLGVGAFARESWGY